MKILKDLSIVGVWCTLIGQVISGISDVASGTGSIIRGIDQIKKKKQSTPK